jgi:hypothetical protein
MIGRPPENAEPVKERVLMVWDVYDGVRSGIALYLGEPHYFDCEFDKKACDYTEVFKLWTIDPELLTLAVEHWEIYRAWEYRYHSGEVPVTTHPGNRGLYPRYDEIQDRIDRYLSSLGEPVHRVIGRFEATDDQPKRPYGCLYEMEVAWGARLA